LQKLTISIVGAFIRFHPFQLFEEPETLSAVHRPLFIKISTHDLVHKPREGSVVTQDPFLDAYIPNVSKTFSAQNIGTVAICGVRKITAEHKITQVIKGNSVGGIAEGNTVIGMRETFNVDGHCECGHNPSR